MPKSSTIRPSDIPWTAAAAGWTAGLALLAWVLGETLQRGISVAVLSPLGAVMIGWFVTAPPATGASARAERRGPTSGSRSLRGGTSGVFAAMTVVALAHGAMHGAVAGLLTALAGVALPALAAIGLAFLSTRHPPRGLGSLELRLLGAALACVPVSTAIRSIGFDADGGIHFDAEQAVTLAADILSATIFAPLMLAIAPAFEALASPDPRRRTSEDTEAPSGAARPPSAANTPEAPKQETADAVSTAVPTGRSGRRMPGSPVSWGPVLLAIGTCSALTILLLRLGLTDFARIMAVGHLLIGLLVARSVPGAIGAALLALNASLMAQVYGGWLDPIVSGDGGAGRHAASLLLMASAFALQFVLQAASTETRENARVLIRQAMQSDLSGLPNHRALARIVGALLARPKRRTFWLVGVVLPDIARWGDLTDSAAAAELERSVAGRLRATFEPLGARVAHPSSGRFVLTIDDRLDGIGIRQRLRATLGGQRFDTSEQSIQLRYLAGMVEVPAAATIGAESVLTALSMALQRAASDPTGIHRATVSAELIEDYRTELRMVELVSRALTEGRIRLFAERIESARKSESDTLHFEVLARVLDESGGLLEPKQFLPAVWHAGLSTKLDRLVFVRTVGYLAAHPRLHAATRTCSINVSGPTLCDPEFVDYVQRCLATHAVDPTRLMIEITESAAIADLELARAHVARLSEMGLKIALDDFGTGLATFDYLKRLRADVLKIDGSFVRPLVDSPLDREIVATMVRIARATGARTIAEWIETPKQRAIVTELGVDLLQGRLIAWPVPIESLELPRQAGDPRRLAVDQLALDDSTEVPTNYQHGRYADRKRPALRSTEAVTAAAKAGRVVARAR
jgi:EAL domain-containing protein (putative c-di-GMP-specific phosphodiesterase class I)/GGDEF domain-containing protein